MLFAKTTYRFAKVGVAFAFFSALFLGCGTSNTSSPTPDAEPSVSSKRGPISFDLDRIRRRGKLIIMTENSSTSYFIYRGQALGFDYELANDFAEHLGVDLEVKLVEDFNAMFDALDEGECDLVAANLTVTKDRSRRVLFSEPTHLTRQVLVQRYPDNYRRMPWRELKSQMVTNQIDLINREVHVRRRSSFYPRLKSLSDEIGGPIHIVEVPGDMDTEELIKQVAEQKILYTVADENVALLNKSFYPNLHVEVPISFPQQIAWAMRSNAPELKAEIDGWMKLNKESGHVGYVYNKYHLHQNKQSDRLESDYSSLAGGKISPYDDFLKEHVATIGDWDWRLLAALVYQESKFDHRKKSWAGAFGIMQLMPSSASRYGIDSTSSAEENMKAGIDKLRRLHDHWSALIKDKDERDKFMLASYNAGLGHVQDACRLAEKYGKDPLIWNDNVEEYMLLKAKVKYYTDEVVKYGYCRGTEPVNYVKEVTARFLEYRKVIQ